MGAGKALLHSDSSHLVSGVASLIGEKLITNKGGMAPKPAPTEFVNGAEKCAEIFVSCRARYSGRAVPSGRLKWHQTAIRL